jgi:hypothetical protein
LVYKVPSEPVCSTAMHVNYQFFEPLTAFFLVKDFDPKVIRRKFEAAIESKFAPYLNCNWR